MHTSYVTSYKFHHYISESKLIPTYEKPEFHLKKTKVVGLAYDTPHGRNEHSLTPVPSVSSQLQQQPIINQIFPKLSK